MKNSKTCKFLSETNLSVIACEDDNVLHDFLKYVAIESDKPIAECTVGEINHCDLSGAEIAIVKGIHIIREQRVQIVQKLKDIKDIAKAHNAHVIVPLEDLACEPHLVTAELRHVYFRIQESDKPDIQMFRLHYFGSKLRLECEFGKNAGRYIEYNYTPMTGKFEPRYE